MRYNNQYTKHKSPSKYTYFNSGNSYDFNPDKPIYDTREPDKRHTALTYHMNLVKLFDDPSVFIVDDKGVIVFKSDKPVQHTVANWRKLIKSSK